MYYLMIKYPGSREHILMHSRGQAVNASEETRAALVEMGQKLLDENIIHSYQLLQVAAPEVAIVNNRI